MNFKKSKNLQNWKNNNILIFLLFFCNCLEIVRLQKLQIYFCNWNIIAFIKDALSILLRYSTYYIHFNQVC